MVEAQKHPKDGQSRDKSTIDLAAFKQALESGFILKKEDSEGKAALVTNEKLLALAENLAEQLKNTTSSRQKDDTVSQFRKFFNEVKGLKQSDPIKLPVDLRLLRARMGYAAGRGIISKEFSLVINACIDRLLSLKPHEPELKAQITGLCDFFESLYAYYHYYSKS